MNNNDLSEMLKKAQDMIKNNQVPKEITDLASQLSQNTKKMEFNNTDSSTNNISPSVTTSQSNSSKFDPSKIDMNTLLKMQNILSKYNNSSDDDMTKLLFALKPYLRNEKQEKINEYVNLIKMGKIAQLLNVLGGDKN